MCINLIWTLIMTCIEYNSTCVGAGDVKVHILQKGLKVGTYCGTSGLRKTHTALQLTVQLTLGCKLQDEIDTR